MADFAPVIAAAFGHKSPDVIGVERLTGGSRKGVYRLTLDAGVPSASDSSVVAYVWNDDENYWPASGHTDSDDQSPDSGFNRFCAAHRALEVAGVEVPRIHLLDRSWTLVAGDLVILQDLNGGTLEEWIANEPEHARETVELLGATVRAMHAQRRDYPGLPGNAAPAALGEEESRLPVKEPGLQIASAVKERAQSDLAEAAARVPRIADAERRIVEALEERFRAIRPRRHYGLVHGELGPDHVLLTRTTHRPVLIDIEGVHFTDIEYEHAFLELRFADRYRPLSVDGLDPDRLRLYRLTTYLSLVAGPLRLLDGDFPRRAEMLDIVEQNVRRTLGQL